MTVGTAWNVEETDVSITLPIKVLPHGKDLALPSYHSAHAAGLDLVAAVPDDAPVTLEPGARALVPSGCAVAIPSTHEGQIRPRSGLALQHGVTVLNSPGTIDADYRGEIGVLLINHGDESFTIARGLRIAQLVISPISRADLSLVHDLDATKRGGDGFGSTGSV